MLFNRNIAIIDALAFVTLFKYGVWAVIMNILMIAEQEATINGVMLILSHGIMACEAIYFYPRFKVTILGFIVSFIWVCINDVIDYGAMDNSHTMILLLHIQHKSGYYQYVSVSLL